MTVALFSALNCQVNEYKTAKPALIRDIVIFEATAKGFSVLCVL